MVARSTVRIAIAVGLGTVACASALAACSLDAIGRLAVVFEGEDVSAPGVPSDPETPDREADAAVAGPTCAHTCIAAPAGWTGPFAVSQGASECGQEDLARNWARSVGSASAAPPAECTCACGAISASCDVRLRANFRQANCRGNISSYTIPADGGCRPISVTDLLERSDQYSSPRCPPIADASIPKIDASIDTVGCFPKNPEGCEAGVCFPPVGSAQLCVRFAGDAGAAAEAGVACPPEFPNAVSLAAGLEDSRACSPCACVPRGNWQCTNVQVTAYRNDNCTGGTAAVNAGCASGYGNYDSARVTSFTVTGQCDPDGGKPIGTVVQVPGEQICCK
jgi:hypothetical protein